MQQERCSSSDRPLDPRCMLTRDAEGSEDRLGRAAVDFPVAVVLPAGGSGERMGLPTPKQFCTILNRPLISYTIQAFERLSWIGTVVVVVAKENHDLMLNIVQKFNHTKVKVVDGGTTRHRSIFNGLQAFSNTTDSLTPEPKVVIIHDAVRPFVEEDLLLKITLAAKEQGASGTIRPLVSTVIATTSEGYLDHSLERAKYRASEMPQGFLYDIIFQAYQRCSEFDFEFGTECLHLALQYCSTNAKLIEGPPTLWKVTYKRDLAAAEAIIKETLSMSACIIAGAEAEAVELAKTLQKNLNMIETDIISGAKESNTEYLSKTQNFIYISMSGSNFSGVLEMVKRFEDLGHARLYPVVIVWHICLMAVLRVGKPLDVLVPGSYPACVPQNITLTLINFLNVFRKHNISAPAFLTSESRDHTPLWESICASFTIPSEGLLDNLYSPSLCFHLLLVFHRCFALITTTDVMI